MKTKTYQRKPFVFSIRSKKDGAIFFGASIHRGAWSTYRNGAFNRKSKQYTSRLSEDIRVLCTSVVEVEKHFEFWIIAEFETIQEAKDDVTRRIQESNQNNIQIYNVRFRYLKLE